jgi:uncharacterized protein
VSGIDTDGPVDPLLPPPVVRILALSGGGYRGLFTAEVLARLEQDSKRKIRDLVDLVIGTSAGALVAAGVAAGVAASDVAAAFRTHGERIFPRRILPAPRRLLFRAPYRSEPLGAAVEEIFEGDARLPMSALQANLAITAVSQTHARFRLYTSGQFVGATSKDLPLLEAILASAAAPTYFPPRFYDKETLVDGGVVANAPEIAGIGLVKRVLGTPLDRMRVLSIGTASPAAGNLPMAPARYSIVDWMLPRRNLLLLTLDTQEHLARNLAEQLLGTSYCRIDIAPNNKQAKVMGALDQAGEKASEALCALADQAWLNSKSTAMKLLAG